MAKAKGASPPKEMEGSSTKKRGASVPPMKSSVQLLQEALEQGDVEGAKRIAEEMARVPVVEKAPRRPAKRPAKPKVPPPQPVLEEAASGPPGPSSLILPGDAGWLAPTRGSGGGRGDNRVAARHESMQGRRFVNTFEDWTQSQERGFDGGTKLSKADQKIAAKVRPVPRPGTPGAARPPAMKVQAYCDGCGRPFMVYPSELMMLDAESVYKCDRCIRRGK